MAARKQFFARHAKSSAALISLIVHAILIIVAFTVVAVTVIQKQEKKFEARSVNRPKMELKRLQVPVNVKKKRPDPKLRKRIVSKPKMNQSMPDIKMPEISGVSGGVGGADGGAGLSGASLGFSMPEIEIFGVKGRGKGEKVIIILNAGNNMMLDERGGATAYNIIKQELVRIIGELPSATLFNVFVFSGKWGEKAFPTLVSANDSNVQQLSDWLMPLNSASKNSYGLKSLGEGGEPYGDAIIAGKFADVKKVGGVGELQTDEWYSSAMEAHKEQADTIFLLTDYWGKQRVSTSSVSAEKWYQTAAGKRWTTEHKEALKKLEEENRQRRAAGQPEKKINRDAWSMAREYYPDIERPPQPTWYDYSPRDFVQAFALVRKQYMLSKVQSRSGLGQRTKSKDTDFSFNVIRFMAKQIDSDDWYEKRALKFQELATLCKGEYKTIPGLQAIQNLVK